MAAAKTRRTQPRVSFKTRLQHGWLFGQYVILMSLSLFATAFILLNGYELAFSKTIPYATALTSVPVRDVIDRNTNSALLGHASLGEGGFGKPVYLKLSTQVTKVEIVPAIYQQGSYLARAATAQYAYLTPAKNGNIGNTIIYLRESWRTVNHPEKLEAGDNLFLDTDREWRYMFRVSNNQVLPASTPFVLADGTTPHLLLAIVSPDKTQIRYITGDFVNIQNVQL